MRFGRSKRNKESPFGLVQGLAFTMLFKRMFKKTVKKREDDEDERDKKGGLTKKDLEDWAKLQQVLKDKEGTIEPDKISKEPPKKKGPKKIKQGYNYLYKEARPTKAYKTFLKNVKKDTHGLVITSTYPQKIRDTYDVDTDLISIFWLSDWYGASQEFLNIGEEEKTLRPSRLDFEIMKEISNFIKKNRGKGILLLDGIEALVLANSFEKVIAFLTNVNNMASANQCTIIAPINPGVFRKRDRFILEKIFDDVNTFINENELDDEE